ncbi:MAG: hypothetical protein U0M28_03710 [Bacteroidales bacterium]|nr:hypothetical protein [Bacteroidales bacterium]
MTYHDRNNKKIRQGDILHYIYDDGSANVMPVSKKNGELGIDSNGEFIPLSETCLEYAVLKRP